MSDPLLVAAETVHRQISASPLPEIASWSVPALFVLVALLSWTMVLLQYLRGEPRSHLLRSIGMATLAVALVTFAVWLRLASPLATEAFTFFGFWVGIPLAAAATWSLLRATTRALVRRLPLAPSTP